MDISIKKDLASHWFKLLQNAICDDILKIEKNKFNFQSSSWKKSSKKDDKEKEVFHKTLRDMCNRHDKNYYKKYKKWCDEYFYLPHRKEAVQKMRVVVNIEFLRMEKFLKK